MRFIRYCLWTLHIACTFSFIPKIRCIMHQRTKRNTEENFSVLLNLYKMNPLGHSKVFKMFSNKILLPNRADSQGTVAMHFDENESTREKQMRANVNLKRIQDAIHASPSESPRRRLGRPKFHVDSVVPEKFSEEITLNDIVDKFGFLQPKEDTFKEFFGHIVESNETTDDILDTERLEASYPTSVTVSQPDFNRIENDNDYKVHYVDEGVVIMR